MKNKKQTTFNRVREGIQEIWLTDPIDTKFLLLVLGILAVGLIVLFSASYASAFYQFGDSYYYIKRQAIFVAIGIVVMWFVSHIDMRSKLVRKLIPVLYVITVILLGLVMVIGKGDGVEKRWLYLGFNFQPSELAKLAVILALAMYLSYKPERLRSFKDGILLPGLIIAVCAGLVLIEPHLSGAVLILFVGVMMMIVAGCNLVWIGTLGVAGAVGLVVVATSVDYMRRRIDVWLNPGSDPLGNGYQILQSLYAIGSGGLTGAGIGQSRQKYLYVSMPQNDFIFSIAAEELGFIGALIIIALFATLIFFGMMIALRNPNRFESLIAFGIMTRLAIQVLLNLAVVTNAIPVTGISLPFFSSGGTAMTMQLIEMGIVLSVSRRSQMRKA